jgi:hypothetical protein
LIRSGVSSMPIPDVFLANKDLSLFTTALAH